MRPLWGGLASLILAGCLSGCITLLPKEHPVQLYRFGANREATTPPPRLSGTPFTVRAAVGAFDRASAGDKILTVTGEATAYIADARWVASAQSLFESAMIARFDASGGPAALLDRGELATSDYRLVVSVQRFEVIYARAEAEPPVIDIQIDASLEPARDPKTRQARIFEARAPAGANTLAAIVGAYSQGVGEVLGQLVAWVNAKGAG